ncbi:MAG: molybdopterin-dependent oxidoreductase [Xanthomonadales bacterium]|nr:molybdopterin-dependent oxidoreductase [Xanthomonadales bacterium]
MAEVTAICRFCHATCGMVATLEDGRVTRLIGDIDNPMYAGYSCVKGRNYHAFHESPSRLRAPLRRRSDGGFESASSAAVLDEIAVRTRDILDRHGPRSVAMYGGTFSHFCPAGVMLRESFMDAIGSPMRFSNATIDQPGKPISMALHGKWGAGPQDFADADVCMLVGANPLVSMWGGIPSFNPAKRLHEARQRGLKLIVIDPRRTESARKADLHLQCLPGQDVPLLAAMLNVIITEGLCDRAFIEAETEGFGALAAAVAPFTPERVAPRAGIEAGSIIEAARMFARAQRGNVTSGTGPSMAPHGVLMDYLVLALNTVCGRWIKAGERMPNRGVLFRQFSGVARAEKPRAATGFGEALRVRGLTDTAAGLPTAALAEEILTPGEGQVKALFVVGGNPLLSWPNQAKTRRALESLELLVVVDPMLSETARHAHYVIGPRFGFESPAITFGNEGITVYGLSLGYPEPYAQYQPQLIEPPAGSDVLEDWRIFYELGRRMGYPLAFRGQPFDMSTPPTTDGLLSQFVARSRVPLEEIKRHPHGAVFPDAKPFAEPRDAEWPHRLQLAAPVMIAELQGIAAQVSSATATSAVAPLMGDEGGGLRLLMVSRREHALYNSVAHDLPALRRRLPHNPAHLNPVDAARLGVVDGATVEIASSVGRIRAVAHLAPDVREGVVSIAHGFADACTAALIDDATDYEALSGLPRMSALPVTVRPAAATQTTA